jgi:DNA-binding NarL/FixJ family response regulator
MGKIKVVIAEDNKIVLEGYKVCLIDKQIEIINTFSNGLQLIDWLKNNTTDILILDLKMPVLDGIGVLNYFNKNKIIQKTIIVSGHYSVSLDEECRKKYKNIKAFITKAYCHLELEDSIKTVYSGNDYHTIMPVLENMKTKYVKKTEINVSLSKGERELLPFLEDYSYRDISVVKNIQIGTVKSIFQRIRNKLGVNTNIDLAKLLEKIGY